MTLRGKTRPFIDHQAAAEGLREMPGLWLPVGTYRSWYVAQSMANSVRTGNEKLPAYAPAGSFDARVDYDADGEPTLYACYLGEPVEEAA